MTQDELKQTLQYQNGNFTWLIVASNNKNKIGDRAGCVDARGYRRIKIDGKPYKEHHLTWLYFYGYLPTKMIDHINGNKIDNRIENLREVTGSQNQQNRENPKNNSSGYKGVSKCGNKWRAQIQINGEKIHLGVFAIKEEAIVARKASELTYHPFGKR